MIKRTLGLGLLALALNVPAQAAQAAALTASDDAQAGAAARTAVGGSLPEVVNIEASPAKDRVDKAASADPGVPVGGHLGYALIGLGLLLGMLPRRRR